MKISEVLELKKRKKISEVLSYFLTFNCMNAIVAMTNFSGCITTALT